MSRFLFPPLDSGQDYFTFNKSLATFVPSMAKRSAPGPFTAAPIVQGDFNNSSPGDSIYSNLAQISGLFYQKIDLYQGAITFWITPEWDGDDGLTHEIVRFGIYVRIEKTTGNDLTFLLENGNYLNVDISSWTAGTTYQVTVRWDTKKTLDGTNHMCFSINDSHTFGNAVQPSPAEPTFFYIGMYNVTTSYRSSNAIIEGLTIYRRPLFDGTYGIDVGNGDEINLIYNAGSGTDPTEITGSWDVTFCLPTNSSTGALTTGTGEAWSHPHSSNVLTDGFNVQGNTPGTYLEFNGSNTEVGCGSDASIDDVPSSGLMTVEAWFVADSQGVDSTVGRIVDKSNDSANGWYLGYLLTDTMAMRVNCDTTDAIKYIDFAPDGKWHHIAATYNDATKTVNAYLDGVEATGSQVIGAGAYSSDASIDLYFGRQGNVSDRHWHGKIAWVRLSDNIRYSSNFVPPAIDSPPATDANTVEQWNLNDGSGSTATAEVSTPTNDGTITNGAWAESWKSNGTPLTPKSVVFDGSATYINCGSDASLDDLPTADFTVECWLNMSSDIPEVLPRIISKQDNSNLEGWNIGLQPSTGNLSTTIRFDTTNAVYSSDGGVLADDRWYHVAMVWDGTAKTAKLFINGIEPSYDTQTAGSGSYLSDAANDFVIGQININKRYFGGLVAWARVSNNKRYTVNFTPPSRTNPPSDDGNTISLWRMEEGAGTAVADSNANGNDGTITSGSWNISKVLDVDAPGSRVYNWGYTVMGNPEIAKDGNGFPIIGPNGETLLATTLFYDRFLKTDAAPITSPRTAEPGPGTWTITDTGNHLSVSGGQLSGDGVAGSWDPQMQGSSPFTRTPGLGLFAKWTYNGTRYVFGFSRTPLNSNDDNFLSLGDTNTDVFRDGLDTVSMGSHLTSGKTYLTAIIARSAGGFLFLKNVTDGGDWFLGWVGNNNNEADMYPSITERTNLFQSTYDYLRVAQLPIPFSVDGGNYTDSIANPAAGNTFIHKADFGLEFDLVTLPSSGSILIFFRVQDASNYWRFDLDTTGYMQLWEFVGGSPTSRGFAGAVLSGGERIRLEANGNDITAWYDNTLAWTHASDGMFATETDGEVDSLGTGGDIDNLIVYPMVLTDEVRGSWTSGTRVHDADGYVSFVLTTLPSGGQVDIRFRKSDSDGPRLLLVSTSNISLQEVRSGAPTTLDSALGVLASGDFIEVMLNGANGEVYQNGDLLLSTNELQENLTGTSLNLNGLGTGGVVSHVKTYQLSRPLLGYATDWLPGQRTEGEAFTHEADCHIEFVLGPDVNANRSWQINFRIQDASNYWNLQCYHGATGEGDATIRLREIVSGLPTTRGEDLTATLHDARIVVIANGDTISVLVDGVQAFSYTDGAPPMNFKTKTTGVISTASSPVEWTISDLVTWPLTPSGNAVRVLEGQAK